MSKKYKGVLIGILLLTPGLLVLMFKKPYLLPVLILLPLATWSGKKLGVYLRRKL